MVQVQLNRVGLEQLDSWLRLLRQARLLSWRGMRPCNVLPYTSQGMGILQCPAEGDTP
jgi:hypothetical protein